MIYLRPLFDGSRPDALPLACVVIGALIVAAVVFDFVWTRFLRPELTKDGAGRVVGRVAVVSERIDELAGTGEVTVSGQRWSARTESVDDVVEVGTRVAILRVEGATVIVREDPEN